MKRKEETEDIEGKLTYLPLEELISSLKQPFLHVCLAQIRVNSHSESQMGASCRLISTQTMKGDDIGSWPDRGRDREC